MSGAWPPTVLQPHQGGPTTVGEAPGQSTARGVSRTLMSWGRPLPVGAGRKIQQTHTGLLCQEEDGSAAQVEHLLPWARPR